MARCWGMQGQNMLLGLFALLQAMAKWGAVAVGGAGLDEKMALIPG